MLKIIMQNSSIGKKTVYILTFLILSLILQSCQKEYYQYLAREKERSSLEFYYKALDFFEAGQLDSAMININRALKIKPNYAPYHFLKGKIYHLQDDTAKAIEFFEKALLNKSFYPDVWKELAPLYLAKNDYSLGLKYYVKLMNNFRDNEEYRLNAAICYNRLDRPKAALDLLLPVLSRMSDVHSAYREIIFAYRVLKEDEKCITFFEEYEARVGQNVKCDVIEQILEIYLRQNQLEKMLSNANRGLQLCRDNALWNYYRYLYFKRKGNDNLAEIELRQIESKVQYQPSLLYFLGRYYFEKGLYQKSAEYWSRLTRFDRISTLELETILTVSLPSKTKAPLIKELYRRTKDKKWKKELETISKGK